MNKIFGILIVILAAYVSYNLINESGHTHEDEDFHYHAGFRVVVDGELQNYDGGDYMHFTPCGIAPSKDLTDPFERLHLHNYIGDVIHAHVEHVSWREFFQGLKMNELLERDDVSVYISGVKTGEGLDTLVNEYDSVLIVFGDETLVDLEDQKYWTSKERVLEGESGVEYCGDED